MDIHIRPATINDADVIVRYNIGLARETEEKALDEPTVQRGVRALLSDASKGLYFVAEAAGEVIGQMMITYEWSDWRNGTFWWIQSVYIHADWRAKGVFRQLYGYIKSLAESNGSVCGLRLYVEHSNDRAQRTYASLGMKKTGYEFFECEFAAGKDVDQ